MRSNRAFASDRSQGAARRRPGRSWRHASRANRSGRLFTATAGDDTDGASLFSFDRRRCDDCGSGDVGDYRRNVNHRSDNRGWRRYRGLSNGGRWRRWRLDRGRDNSDKLLDDRCNDHHRGGSRDDRLGPNDLRWCGGFRRGSLLGRPLTRLGRLFGLNVSLQSVLLRATTNPVTLGFLDGG